MDGEKSVRQGGVEDMWRVRDANVPWPHGRCPGRCLRLSAISRRASRNTSLVSNCWSREGLVQLRCLTIDLRHPRLLILSRVATIAAATERYFLIAIYSAYETGSVPYFSSGVAAGGEQLMCLKPGDGISLAFNDIGGGNVASINAIDSVLGHRLPANVICH
jgi:hypothetical protein